MKPILSIIIPTYNRKKFLLRAINSIYHQSFQNFEILICDDGSSDSTMALVKSISQRDSRVRWISGKHSGGPATPRNRGLKFARGEWVAFLDSDDTWLPSKIEHQSEQNSTNVN